MEVTDRTDLNKTLNVDKSLCFPTPVDRAVQHRTLNVDKSLCFPTPVDRAVQHSSVPSTQSTGRRQQSCNVFYCHRRLSGPSDMIQSLAVSLC